MVTLGFMLQWVGVVSATARRPPQFGTHARTPESPKRRRWLGKGLHTAGLQSRKWRESWSPRRHDPQVLTAAAKKSRRCGPPSSTEDAPDGCRLLAAKLLSPDPLPSGTSKHARCRFAPPYLFPLCVARSATIRLKATASPGNRARRIDVYFILKNFTNTPPHHVTQDGVSAPILEMLEVSVRGHGGIIAVMCETRWA